MLLCYHHTAYDVLYTTPVTIRSKNPTDRTLAYTSGSVTYASDSVTCASDSVTYASDSVTLRATVRSLLSENAGNDSIERFCDPGRWRCYKLGGNFHSVAKLRVGNPL